MEALESPCYSDMGMDHSFLEQWELTSLAHEFNAEEHLGVALRHDLERCPSSESYSSYASVRPKKIAKTNSWSSSTTTELNSVLLPDASASGPKILSFGNPVCAFRGSLVSEPKEEMDVPVAKGPKRGRTTSHNQEHIMAERKRREKLSQRFIALSAIVPGLKKKDKASVLGDGIKYLKQLQEKVQSLEEQIAKRNVESAVLVRKSQLSSDDDSSSCDENCNEGHDESLPEIEAKVCDKSILIKIHCENKKGALVRVISEIEKLRLSVMNTNVMTFTGASLDITVMTQMEEEFCITAKDLVKKLNSAFRQFM
ncbi:transcription factor bHLH25-like [Curcuma longa]|uniref:transcription factor bHLH25-like n=1 Tax=Curcuma longa TaxID=136217 RepID=UPI003D9EF62D